MKWTCWTTSSLVDGEGVGIVGSPEANLVVSALLSVQDFWRDAERHGPQMGLCWTSRVLDVQENVAIPQLWEYLDDAHCVIMSPKDDRLTDFAVETVGASREK